MLSRNDTITLWQQVDVGKALDLLEKLEQLAGNHGTCNVSEFSAWMKFVYQTSFLCFCFCAIYFVFLLYILKFNITMRKLRRAEK